MRKLVGLLLLCLLVPLQGWAGQNQLDSDTFTDTDGTFLQNHSANWPYFSNHINFCAIQSNGVNGQACGHYRTGQTWTDDQYGQLTLLLTPTTGERVGVMLRTATNGDWSGYFCGYDEINTGSLIYRIAYYSATTFTNIQAEPGSTTAQASDIINCQIVGTTITMKVTRSGVDAFTPFTGDGSTTFTTGDPGFVSFSATTTVLDDWFAGSVTGAGGAPVFFQRRLQ